MNHPFRAIYEDGVLRPLHPIDLPDQAVVSLSIVDSAGNGTQVGDEEVLQQKQTLLAFVSKMESLTDENPQDGFSNRDHDRLIYGK